MISQKLCSYWNHAARLKCFIVVKSCHCVCLGHVLPFPGYELHCLLYWAHVCVFWSCIKFEFVPGEQESSKIWGTLCWAALAWALTTSKLFKIQILAPIPSHSNVNFWLDQVPWVQHHQLLEEQCEKKSVCLMER
jgi:hypothetical protein